MKTLELFAGSQSFTKVAKEFGFETFTSDISDIKGINYVVDILNFDVNKVPFVPDVIWASPDYATWSKASGCLPFDSKSLEPKTEKATLAFVVIDKTIEIINYYLNLNKDLKFYIENPQSRLQKYLQAGTLFSPIPRLVVIDQCQYGREYKKTTHIFTNDMSWKIRQRCQGTDKCNHLKSIKNIGDTHRNKKDILSSLYYVRAKIPYQLCFDILSSLTKNITEVDLAVFEQKEQKPPKKKVCKVLKYRLQKAYKTTKNYQASYY